MSILDSYLVFDFETTGLKSSRDRIIQVGLCRVVNDGMVAQESWLVRQAAPIDPEAHRKHGITLEDLETHGISPQESFVGQESWQGEKCFRFQR